MAMIAADAEVEAVAAAADAEAPVADTIELIESQIRGFRYHHLYIRDGSRTEIRAALLRIRNEFVIRRLYVDILDQRTERHCTCLTTLFRELRKRPQLRLSDIILNGADFGTFDRAFHQMTFYLKKLIVTSKSLRAITIAECNFRSLSHFVGIGQSLACSKSIRDIIFRDIDFTTVGGNRALSMSYLNAAFSRHLFSGATKNIYFQECTMLNRHVIELLRGVSGSNHPRTFSLEGGNTQFDTYACAVLGIELSEHSEANGSLSRNAYATTIIPPITLVSLEGVQIGDEGVSSLLLTQVGRERRFGFVRLNLSGCGLTDVGCEYIASAIRNNRAPFLRTLIIEDNLINDEGSISIAWALSPASQLRCIRMGGSRGCITKESYSAYYHVLFDDRTPDHVETSNCSISCVTLDCLHQHDSAIPTKTSERLRRVLCINANSQLMGKNTRLVAKREKLFELIYNKYLDYGERNFLNELFRGTQTPDTHTASAPKYIHLLLHCLSSYRQHRDSVIQNNPVAKNKKYWTTQANSIRELTLLYSAVRIRVSTALRNETRYNFRSRTKWARHVR